MTGEVVDLGYGLPADLETTDVDGQIVMVRSDLPPDADHRHHRIEKYAFALEAGADTFIFQNHLDGCLPPTDEVGYGNRLVPIPAVGVSSELGSRLARYAATGATVSVLVDCEMGPATAPNIGDRLGRTPTRGTSASSNPPVDGVSTDQPRVRELTAIHATSTVTNGVA